MITMGTVEKHSSQEVAAKLLSYQYDTNFAEPLKSHAIVKIPTKDVNRLFANDTGERSIDFEQLWQHNQNNQEFTVFRLSPKVLHRLKRSSHFEYLTRNFQKWIDDSLLRPMRSINNYPSKLVPNFQLDIYQPLDEIYRYLDYLNKLDHVRVFDIGTTHEGRKIKAIEITGDPNDHRIAYIDAGIHAREWVAPSTALFIIDKIISSKVKINFLIVPMVNPDGYEYTWTVDRLWRKSRRPTNKGSLSDECNGVDLNRNFDISFGGEGSSTNMCSALYQGPAPFSEPETLAIGQLIWRLRNRIKFFISLHSFNQLWACPYAFKKSASEHINEHMDILRAIQSASSKTNGIQYDIGPLSKKLYIGSGFSMDWAYIKAGIVHSYLVELRDKGTYGFLLPVEQIIPTANEAWNGIKAGIYKIFRKVV